MIIAFNITQEQDTKEKSIKTPKMHDSTKIAQYCKQHWGELVNWNKKEQTLYLCDNSIMGTPEFTELLKKWRIYIQPSLF